MKTKPQIISIVADQASICCYSIEQCALSSCLTLAKNVANESNVTKKATFSEFHLLFKGFTHQNWLFH